MNPAAARVFFVNRVYRPSSEATAQLLTDLAEALAAGGRAVHVVAAGTSDETLAGVSVHRVAAGDAPQGLVARALGSRRFIRAACARLETLLGPGDVVVALTDPPLLGTAVQAVAARRGARCLHWIPDIYPEIAAVHFGPLAGLALAGARRERDRAWADAQACVVLGADMAAHVRARGVDPARIAILPNWAPRELAAPPAPSAVAARRAEWGVADRFVVAYSGNLGRVHEFETVLDAAERLRGDPGVVLLVIGRGPRHTAVRAAAQRRGLAAMRFLPPQPREELAVALAAADAHLVTLRPAYGSLVFPSKLAGACAAGRPVLFVGPPDGDIARLLRTLGGGAAFAPGEAAGLADTIARWRADAALVRTLGAQARAVAEADYALPALLARWTALLDAPNQVPFASVAPGR